jgi:hypothetical protein
MKQPEASMAIQVIIDNSGSMAAVREEVIKGVNEFIEQLTTGVQPALLTVTLFDDVLKKNIVKGVSIAERPRVKDADYDPNWGTENIAFCVIKGLERLAPQKAHRKVLVVVTDGLNVSSDMAEARELVAKRQSEGWLVLWFGIYEPKYAEVYGYKDRLASYAADLGIPKGVTFAFDCYKIDKAMPLAAKAALRFEATGSVEEAAFTDKERASIEKK